MGEFTVAMVYFIIQWSTFECICAVAGLGKRFVDGLLPINSHQPEAVEVRYTGVRSQQLDMN